MPSLRLTDINNLDGFISRKYQLAARYGLWKHYAQLSFSYCADSGYSESAYITMKMTICSTGLGQINGSIQLLEEYAAYGILNHVHSNYESANPIEK